MFDPEDEPEVENISVEVLVELTAQRVVEVLQENQLLTSHDVAMIRSHVLPKDEGILAYGREQYRLGFEAGAKSAGATKSDN